ncbi:hypothetical protein WJX73_004213 [Symbiochloris irregularis]|uniref:Uncharacterized protein n=1 Tax=Symbiochloris irregularis TaxID=706552 RepID=A0AAW1NQA9_9CHLO
MQTDFQELSVHSLPHDLFTQLWQLVQAVYRQQGRELRARVMDHYNCMVNLSYQRGRPPKVWINVAEGFGPLDAERVFSINAYHGTIKDMARQSAGTKRSLEDAPQAGAATQRQRGATQQCPPEIHFTCRYPFVPCPQFVGSRHGYHFKLGPEGLGYYLEAAVAAVAASAAGMSHSQPTQPQAQPAQ